MNDTNASYVTKRTFWPVTIGLAAVAVASVILGLLPRLTGISGGPEVIRGASGSHDSPVVIKGGAMTAYAVPGPWSTVPPNSTMPAEYCTNVSDYSYISFTNEADTTKSLS